MSQTVTLSFILAYASGAASLRLLALAGRYLWYSPPFVEAIPPYTFGVLACARWSVNLRVTALL